eukprot:346964_1
MYSTPDGSEVKLQLAPTRVTPGGPGPKKYATPLSPSLTDEVNSQENRALPSTANDELFAWLLQHKVDDEKIANYLCERDIDLTELSELGNEELKDLLKDVEDESGSKLQMIDKNRFIKGCKKLRPQQSQSPQPQPQPQHHQPHHIPPQHAQQAIPHRGSQSHFHYPPPHASPSPHPPYDRNQPMNPQYVRPYSIGQPQPQPQIRHMSLTGNQQQPPPQQPQPQPQVQYYPHPQSGLPVAHVMNANGNPNRGYYSHVPPQQQQQYLPNKPPPQQAPPPLHASHYAQQMQHRASAASMHKDAVNGANNDSFGHKYNAIPLPDEYKARGTNKNNMMNRAPPQVPPQPQQQQPHQRDDPDEITTKGLLDELEKEDKPHHRLNTNTKSSNIPSGSELGSNLASNVEESQNSYYSGANDREIERSNNATVIQHNLQIHHASANSQSKSNTKSSSGHSPHYSNSHSGDRERDRDRDNMNNNINHSVISAMAPSMITDNEASRVQQQPMRSMAHNNNNNNNNNKRSAMRVPPKRRSVNFTPSPLHSLKPSQRAKQQLYSKSPNFIPQHTSSSFPATFNSFMLNGDK